MDLFQRFFFPLEYTIEPRDGTGRRSMVRWEVGEGIWYVQRLGEEDDWWRLLVSAVLREGVVNVVLMYVMFYFAFRG